MLDPVAKTLEYFEEPGGKPKGTVQLVGAQVLGVPECQDQISADNCFAVITQDVSLYMRDVRVLSVLGCICVTCLRRVSRVIASCALPLRVYVDLWTTPIHSHSV